MTKKNVLYLLLTATLILLVVFFENEICGFSKCSMHFDKLPYLFIFASPAALPLLFSLITYKMKEEVFQAWRNFSYWWIPLTMFLTLITPDSNSVIMSWGKEVPAMGMTLLYVLISIIIILRTWLKTRKEGAVADKS